MMFETFYFFKRLSKLIVKRSVGGLDSMLIVAVSSFFPAIANMSSGDVNHISQNAATTARRYQWDKKIDQLLGIYEDMVRRT